MSDETRLEAMQALQGAIKRCVAIAAEENMVAEFKFRPDGLAVVVTAAAKLGAEGYVRSIPWSQLESDEEFTLTATISGATDEAITRLRGIMREVR